MKHYIILDQHNMPVGDHYEDIGPIDVSSFREKNIFLYDTVIDKYLDYRPDEHRVFEAKIGSCTLNGGNGRWCDRVNFIREVSKEECLAMKPAHYIELPEGMTWGDVPVREEIGMVVFNPKGVAKMKLEP